jgi:hypothetical protein
MTTKEMVEVMLAYENGKQIQYRGKHNIRDEWLFCKHPSWNWELYEYRIKPESRTAEDWWEEFKLYVEEE